MKPRTLWSAFLICLAIVLASLAWISATVVQLENSKQLASQNAARERNNRLALYRIENAAAALIAQENNRPYFHFTAFYAPARAYDAFFEPPNDTEKLIASPLLNDTDACARLHFQILPDGTFTSPEDPDDALLALAHYTGATPQKATRLTILRASFPDASIFLKAAKQAAENAQTQNTATPAYAQDSPFSETDDEIEKSVDERQKRLQIFNNDTAENPPSPFATTQKNPQKTSGKMTPLRLTGAPSPFFPIWIESELFLLRTLKTNHDTIVIQGVWLDWQALKNRLTERIGDLLPDATLRPANTENPNDTRNRNTLATLPISLLNTTQTAMTPVAFSTERITLIIIWCFAIFAFTAFAFLLRASVSLSERRATFVSAVTHELRTPLTTFQLYTEMLSDGMVPPESQKKYLNTLRTEAMRLTHLVENVLGFARLEKGRALRRDETLTVREIFNNATDRLRTRLEAGKMKLVCEVNDTAREITLRTDGTAIEQILFNLADNAAKYASTTGDTATLRITANDTAVAFEFSDNGNGISPSAKKKLFKPFNRSAEDAAGKKPGVGLGLAFSRQLARRLGGNLRLKKSDTTGATFELTLPITEKRIKNEE